MSEKRLVVAFTGKGGTGKTVLTALALKLLLKQGRKNLLIVDADPATNLPDVLGIKIDKTVGMVATELKKKIGEADQIPPDIDKKSLLEGLILQTLVETPQFDLLAMGRTEGEGCYCLVNNLLTHIIDTLSKNYELTLMDMEAGLEHLSRRTDRDVDILIVVTDPSKMGIETARRIKELAKEVHIKFHKIYLVGNMIPPNLEETIQKQAENIGIKLAGTIPADTNIANSNLTGSPLLELPDNTPALTATQKILEKITLT